MKYRNILAALFFLGIGLVGLKLSLWQYSRYQLKISIDNSLADKSNSTGDYQLFEEVLVGRDDNKILLVLTPDAKNYQIYCPVQLNQKVLYLQREKRSPANEDLQFIKEGYCSDIDNKKIQLAKVPVQRNIFIPKSVIDKKDAIFVNQISDYLVEGSYLVENPDQSTFYTVTPAKHLGYALQWLLLAFVSLLFSFYCWREIIFTKN